MQFLTIVSVFQLRSNALNFYFFSDLQCWLNLWWVDNSLLTTSICNEFNHINSNTDDDFSRVLTNSSEVSTLSAGTDEHRFNAWWSGAETGKLGWPGMMKLTHHTQFRVQAWLVLTQPLGNSTTFYTLCSVEVLSCSLISRSHFIGWKHDFEFENALSIEWNIFSKIFNRLFRRFEIPTV